MTRHGDSHCVNFYFVMRTCFFVATFITLKMYHLVLITKYNQYHPQPQHNNTTQLTTQQRHNTSTQKSNNNNCSKTRQKKMDSTPHCSRVVPNPSTERAQTALTSVFGWEPVDYGWYGRIHLLNYYKQTWNDTDEIELARAAHWLLKPSDTKMRDAWVRKTLRRSVGSLLCELHFFFLCFVTSHKTFGTMTSCVFFCVLRSILANLSVPGLKSCSMWELFCLRDFHLSLSNLSRVLVCFSVFFVQFQRTLSCLSVPGLKSSAPCGSCSVFVTFISFLFPFSFYYFLPNLYCVLVFLVQLVIFMTRHGNSHCVNFYFVTCFFVATFITLKRWILI